MGLLKNSFSRRYLLKIGRRAVLACTEFCQEQFCLCRPLLALNEKTKKNQNICELLQHSPTFFVSFLNGKLVKKVLLRAVLACAESNVSNFKFEYLREKEFLRKTILACLSGAPMGLIHEKKRGRKSRDTAPLKNTNLYFSKFCSPTYGRIPTKIIFCFLRMPFYYLAVCLI